MCILVKDALQLVKASLTAFRNQHLCNSILGLKFVSLIQKENGVKTRYEAARTDFYWTLHHNRGADVSFKQFCQGKL